MIRMNRLFALAVIGLLLALSLAFPCLHQSARAAPNASVHYVRQGATGDCAAWGSACSLQAALDAAASGDQVWVAAGTYVENITMKIGVALYGGFAGTETYLSQRSWTAVATLFTFCPPGPVERMKSS